MVGWISSLPGSRPSPWRLIMKPKGRREGHIRQGGKERLRRGRDWTKRRGERKAKDGSRHGAGEFP